ncbi:hypothetical protein NL108_006527, partial [Boleophthalmus pectinirostris]
RKQKNAQRLVELQERRRGLQTMLSTRLAELRRVCLQEAELTGLIPEDFPLEEGEKLPSVRRRGGSRLNRKNRAELEEKKKKTLFSSVRKHSEPEHIPHLQSQRSKRTVHRGCHTDESVRSESSSTSDSTGHDNALLTCFSKLKTYNNNLAYMVFPDQTLRMCPRNTLLHTPLLRRLDPWTAPPPLGRQSRSSWAELGVALASNGGRANGANRSVANGPVGGANSSRRSNSSDGLLDRGASTEADGHWVNDPGQRGRAPYSDLLLDYVWTKQQQMLQRQQSHGSRQPITALYPNQQPNLAPPTYRGMHSDRQRIKVTRTKSCGPFLPVQPPGAENFDSQHAPLQPDPHPHLLPPRPTQAALTQDQHNEEATRNLHKALALE